MQIENLSVTPAPGVPSRQKVPRGRLRQRVWIAVITLSVAFWAGLYFFIFF